MSYFYYLLLIFFFTVITIILFYNSYLDNKYYNEGIEIINKLSNVKKRDEIFNSIKKYYINLERSKDRLESIEKEFKDYEIGNYERIEACDGRDLSSTRKGKFKELEFENIKDNTVTKAELATTCSHLKAIKKAYDDGEEMAIIMEDDMNFTLMPHWKKSLREILDNIPEDLELLQLVSGTGNQKLNKLLQRDFYKNLEEQKIIKRKNKRHAFCCYLILKKGMEKIINKNFEGKKIILNQKETIADSQLILGFLNSYYLNQNLFLLDSFKLNTTIHTDNRNNYYETLQTLKLYNY